MGDKLVGLRDAVLVSDKIKVLSYFTTIFHLSADQIWGIKT